MRRQPQSCLMSSPSRYKTYQAALCKEADLVVGCLFKKNKQLNMDGCQILNVLAADGGERSQGNSVYITHSDLNCGNLRTTK